MELITLLSLLTSFEIKEVGPPALQASIQANDINMGTATVYKVFISKECTENECKDVETRIKTKTVVLTYRDQFIEE